MTQDEARSIFSNVEIISNLHDVLLKVLARFFLRFIGAVVAECAGVVWRGVVCLAGDGRTKCEYGSSCWQVCRFPQNVHNLRQRV